MKKEGSGTGPTTGLVWFGSHHRLDARLNGSVLVIVESVVDAVHNQHSTAQHSTALHRWDEDVVACQGQLARARSIVKKLDRSIITERGGCHRDGDCVQRCMRMMPCQVGGSVQPACRFLSRRLRPGTTGCTSASTTHSRQSRPVTGGRPLGVRWGREGRAVPAVSDVKQLKPCSSTPPRTAAHPMTPDSRPRASPDSVTRRVCQLARRARLKLMWGGTVRAPGLGYMGQSKAPHFSTTPVPATKTSPTGSPGLAPICTLHTPNILILLPPDTLPIANAHSAGPRTGATCSCSFAGITRPPSATRVTLGLRYSSALSPKPLHLPP